MFYFVCLVMWRDEVVCTEYVCSDDCCKRSRLEFTNLIQLKNLPPDFQITLDVYGLQAKREKFSHNEKFHINTVIFYVQEVTISTITSI